MKIPLILLIPALLAAACTSSIDSPVITPISLDKNQSTIVEADNTFGLRLLGKLNAADGDSNIFISPLSISMALAMTLNGAVGPTRDSMERALALSGLTPLQINEAYKSLVALLVGHDPSVKLSIANSIWYRNGLAVEQEFIKTNRDYFDALVSSLDFSSSDAAARIDAWVNEKTSGRIPSIAPNPIPDNLVMFLINAIYFKGSWQEKFQTAYTVDAEFTCADGSTVPVKMMNRSSDSLSHFSDDRMQMIDLPYGGGSFSMVIALPQPGRSLDSMIAGLDAPTWKLWMSRLRTGEGDIAIPRFTLAWADTLGGPLRALGMGLAFSRQADFTRINRLGETRISQVRHKTFLEVNEEGTEAAAATSVEAAVDSIAIRFSMRADRPFLLAIRERRSGSILFIGKVMKP